MKKFFKNPLKMVAVGMFVVAMGFGVSISLEKSESKDYSYFSLDALLTVAHASGEGSGYCSNFEPENCKPKFITCPSGQRVIRCVSPWEAEWNEPCFAEWQDLC